MDHPANALKMDWLPTLVAKMNGMIGNDDLIQYGQAVTPTTPIVEGESIYWQMTNNQRLLWSLHETLRLCIQQMSCESDDHNDKIIALKYARKQVKSLFFLDAAGVRGTPKTTQTDWSALEFYLKVDWHIVSKPRYLCPYCEGRTCERHAFSLFFEDVFSGL